ncbi:MAG: trigger factor [Deltaproteobacteria bacterium]
MKVTFKQKKDNKMLLGVEVSKELVRKKYDEVYARIGKDAKVPGFRPGKAPRHVLEQHHSALAREEVIKGLVAESYDKGVKEEQIDVIDLPEISEVRLADDVLTYKAEVEVKPEIQIKQYKGLKLKKDDISVSAKEVADAVEQLKKDRVSLDDERLARGLGYRSFAELKECLEKQIFLKKENDARAKLEKEALDQLLKNSSFTLPKTLVDRRLHELEHQALHQMADYGMNEEQARQRVKEFTPRLTAQAEEQVRVYLVLEAVAKKEEVAQDDKMLNRTIELLFREADWQ